YGGICFSNRRSFPSELKATPTRTRWCPNVATHVRLLRSPSMSIASRRDQPVSFLIAPTSCRNCSAQIKQQKKIRSPSTSAQTSPQVELQMAHPA
ncbi:MAG: hypothetical protein WCA77_07280, partial [Thermoplasmata archaeon]